jgi:Protein of unknown function (DUF1102).
MNRRNVLIGLGAAATGSSVVLGSGAFTQVSTARSVTIAVDNDSNALIELAAGDPPVIEENTGGELAINTESFGAFNENATVEVGTSNNPANTPAFSVTNNLTDQIDLTLNLIDIDSSGNFTIHFDDSDFGDSDQSVSSNDKTTGRLDSNATVNVAVEVDTQSAKNDFTGTLEVTAEEPTT